MLTLAVASCKSKLSEEIADDSVCGPRDNVLGAAGVSGQVRINPLHLVRSFDFSIEVRNRGFRCRNRGLQGEMLIFELESTHMRDELEPHLVG